MASAFLGKCASIPAVDLIQWKKLGIQESFCKFNLMKARFNSHRNHCSIGIIMTIAKHRGFRVKDGCVSAVI